jgi:hypothetical protein
MRVDLHPAATSHRSHCRSAVGSDGDHRIEHRSGATSTSTNSPPAEPGRHRTRPATSTAPSRPSTQNSPLRECTTPCAARALPVEGRVPSRGGPHENGRGYGHSEPGLGSGRSEASARLKPDVEAPDRESEGPRDDRLRVGRDAAGVLRASKLIWAGWMLKAALIRALHSSKN